jgi:hypothetical protein
MLASHITQLRSLYDNFKASKGKVFSLYLIEHHSDDNTLYSYITGELDSTNINHKMYFEEVLKHVKKLESAASHFIREYRQEDGELNEVITDWFGMWRTQYRIVLSHDLFRDMILYQLG